MGSRVRIAQAGPLSELGGEEEARGYRRRIEERFEVSKWHNDKSLHRLRRWYGGMLLARSAARRVVCQLKALLVPLVLITCSNSTAGQIFCLPGEICERGLDEKIKKSSNEATFVVGGTFHAPTEEHPIEPLSEDISFIYAVFRVDKIYKGNDDLEEVRLKLPVYTANSQELADSESISDKEKLTTLTAEFGRLERELEQGRLSRKQYEAQLELLRRQILNSPEYSMSDFIIIKIVRGDIDGKYRLADVPVKFGDKYILMIFTHLDTTGYTNLSKYQLDVYPEAVGAIVEAVLVGGGVYPAASTETPN